MFWHSAASSNAIDSLLDQPDVQLTTILDQDEVLTEIRAMNKKLLEFLTRNDIMHELLDLITTLPSPDIPIPLQYKFPNTACEVLTSDIGFAQKIAAEPIMMDKLFHFFRDAEPPLNPLLASYVCRVLGEIVGRKRDQNWYSYQLNILQVMGYLQTDPSLLQWLLRHVETSSVCDFFHKLVMGVEGQDMRNSLYDWLENQEHFFLHLINKMDNKHNKEAHANICHLIGDLLFALQDESSSTSQDRSYDSEPFLLALKSHALFERLLDVILSEDTLSQSSIVYGLKMLLALLGIKKKPTKQTAKVDICFRSNQNIVVPTSVRETLINKISILFKFLQNPPVSKPIKLSNGELKEPLGQERLAIVNFIAHIISLHDVEINESLIQSGLLKKALDLLWEHPWNSFLHHYVVQIVIQITKITRSDNCAKFVYIDYGLPEKIVEAFDEGRPKAGYLGHLANITEYLAESMDSNPCVNSLVPEWEKAKPSSPENFKQFYEGKWKTYHATATQLLAGAPLPSSGVSMASNSHNYESDPGVTWDSSCTGGDNDGNEDYFDGGANFGSSDRYDDEKSKSIFEMFCYGRSKSADDDEEEANDEGGAVDSTSYDESEEIQGEFVENWTDSQEFFKHLETQENMFSQMNINGTVEGSENPSTSSNVNDSVMSGTNFIANPWAGQESVQVDNSDPWASFEFGNFNNFPTSSEGNDGGWAQFDQYTIPSNNLQVSSDEVQDFTNFASGSACNDEIFPPRTSSVDDMFGNSAQSNNEAPLRESDPASPPSQSLEKSPPPSLPSSATTELEQKLDNDGNVDSQQNKL